MPEKTEKTEKPRKTVRIKKRTERRGGGDDAVRAFRLYARYGFDRCEGLLDVYHRIRGACTDREALEMLAVTDTVRLLRSSGDGETERALRLAYFSSGRGLNTASAGICRAAAELHCDVRTVYRMLSRARKTWRDLADYYASVGVGEVFGERK